LGKVLDTVIRLEAPDVTGFFQNFLYLFAVMRPCRNRLYLQTCFQTLLTAFPFPTAMHFYHA